MPFGDYNLSEELKRAAHAYLVGLGEHGDEMRARIDAVMLVRPHLSPEGARQATYRWFGANPPTERRPGMTEFWRFIHDKQQLLRESEGLTEGEIIAKARRVFDHGVGDRPLMKSQVVRSEEGEFSVVDLELRDPSLSAANTALELLRKVGGFGLERTETRFGGVVQIAQLPLEQREQRVAELAQKAGFPLLPALPVPVRRETDEEGSD
jgi:hypothetical protein